MNEIWTHHFLIGRNQFGSPVLVAFCIDGITDTVKIFPYVMLHPLADPNGLPQLSMTELGSYVHKNDIGVSLSLYEGRVIWTRLCGNPWFEMTPTTFHAHYPIHDYHVGSIFLRKNITINPVVRNLNCSYNPPIDKINSNYALEA
jgi:hypothetical protein